MGNPNAQPPDRGEVKGWTHSSIRRNLLFLYSVDESALTGTGYAVTLTVKTCPATGADWASMRKAFIMRMNRAGMIRMHWVTEWQARGIPHTHCALWFPDGVEPDILGAWLDVSRAFGSLLQGQHVTPIYDAVGWNKYTSKHAARGLYHYQRSPENVPAGWKGRSSGRVWGYLGEWPLIPALKIELAADAFHKYRRIVRAWRIAKDRRPGLPVPVRDCNGRQVAILEGVPSGRAIRAARSMLECHTRNLSTVRGCSQWMGEALAHRVLAWLSGSGHDLLSV
jgi:hypothetical protein